MKETKQETTQVAAKPALRPVPSLANLRQQFFSETRVFLAQRFS